MKLISIVGARPQFIKLSPLVAALQSKSHKVLRKTIRHIIVHTGQHYDYSMSRIFFKELGIEEPDYNLGVGSGSHGWQTAEMMERIEKVFIKEKPDLTLIYGDTNSTIAGALVSAKMKIPLGHIEAGLRSYNRRMPEEINRIVADQCADILFCPTENACQNLSKEGFSNILQAGTLIDTGSISELNFPAVFNVGDIMYDAVSLGLKIAEQKSNILDEVGVESKGFYLATVHRAENADNKNKLRQIIEAICEIGLQMPVIFPVHPRTKKNLSLFQLGFPSRSSVRVVDPISYFDMLLLEKNAAAVLTDSGGMQKEAFFFKVPCVTLREETEWIETLAGGNTLSGAEKQKITDALSQVLNVDVSSYDAEPFGDGQASQRILSVISSLI